jgi:hypothetical protein
MKPDSPWLRFLAGIVAVAVAIRLTYELLRPVLPVLAVVVSLAAVAIGRMVSRAVVADVVPVPVAVVESAKVIDVLHLRRVYWNSASRSA